ncbi:1-acyl-sn-glycerol-3-phosphate acyltransferase [Actinomadura pelletieri DSM 43383]|uniref:1-acyl-sn-glycerol-3-phosphate acyltransferase n=1 Tax=Actinomadura pelletieri DSM 43383 TaxID=1120940 RepID=A0A495QYC4_9ACTN|nr:lysophospholipid acyltransferase family protein [Actinomadura pelletieri]RKS79058.1 1-acyl-sn-glycerol-3-phosphate acyltransferase [Actinomadura pelletieri DSM 43383]
MRLVTWRMRTRAGLPRFGLAHLLLRVRRVTGGCVFYGVLAHTVGPLLRLALRPRVEGRENIPADGPFILASNHLSMVDSFVLSPVIPRRLWWLARSEYFELPGIGGRLIRHGMLALGNVPIRRGPTRAAVRALGRMVDVLDAGGGVAIYPEGSRSPDGRLYLGRRGVAWLALKSGAKVVPVALGGSDQIIPLGTWRPRLSVRPTVRFGEPMDFSRYQDLPPGRARRVITDEVMDAIRKLSDQEWAGTLNPRADDE